MNIIYVNKSASFVPQLFWKAQEDVEIFYNSDIFLIVYGNSIYSLLHKTTRFPRVILGSSFSCVRGRGGLSLVWNNTVLFFMSK